MAVRMFFFKTRTLMKSEYASGNTKYKGVNLNNIMNYQYLAKKDSRNFHWLLLIILFILLIPIQN